MQAAFMEVAMFHSAPLTSRLDSALRLTAIVVALMASMVCSADAQTRPGSFRASPRSPSGTSRLPGFLLKFSDLRCLPVAGAEAYEECAARHCDVQELGAPRAKYAALPDDRC